MHDEEAFLQHIRDNPDDDTPRLVYADWLEETGDPANVARAEFIRVQVALPSADTFEPGYAELRQREAALYARHKRKWNGPIHRMLHREVPGLRVAARRGTVRGWEYRRGFPEVLIAEAEAFLEHPELLFRIGPIRELRVRNLGGRLQQILDSEHFPRLRGLDLRGNLLQNPMAQLLAASPQVRGLTSLNLSGNHLTDAGAQALAASPNLSGLRTLDVSCNLIGRDGLKALAESPHLLKTPTAIAYEKQGGLIEAERLREISEEAVRQWNARRAGEPAPKSRPSALARWLGALFGGRGGRT